MSRVRIERFESPVEVAQVREDSDVPPTGWAIVLDARRGVYRDGVLVGELVQHDTSLEVEGGTRMTQILYLPISEP